MQGERQGSGQGVRILAIHQGAELYGSDRSFAQAVEAMRRVWPGAEIEVRLGSHGPLEALLSGAADRVLVEPMWIARKAGAFRSILLNLPRCLWRTPGHLADLRRFDLVYVNTVVVLDRLLPSLFCGGSMLLHVREIPPASPMGRLIRAAVRHSRATRIFNSRATARAYGLHNALRSTVVLNGVAGPEAAPPLPPGPGLDLALVGRISDWKGQDLAVEALALLAPALRPHVRLRITGSAFAGQEGPGEALDRAIHRAGLEEVVTLLPFATDVGAEYARAHAVLVPSRRPEPFGRVAIEAMSFGRPVIAADHGGLAEIVEHDRSGLLVPPNDAARLAEAMAALARDRGRLERLSQGARARFETAFTAAAMERGLIAALAQVLARG